jgi:ABC-type nitrate/sulfonate/bicarbonate transport system substrate-binding protein
MTKFIKIAIVLLLILSLAVGCKGVNEVPSDKGYTTDVIRVSYSPVSYSSAPLQLLKIRGLLEKAMPDDVRIEWSELNTGNAARDSLVAGQLDVSFMAGVYLTTAVENGLPLVALSNGVVQSVAVFSHNPEIQNLDDFGSTDKISIAGIGSSVHLALMEISKERYGDVHKFDNNLIIMSNSDVIASLRSSNELAGAIVTFPSLKKVDEIDSATMIYNFTDY